MFQPPSSFIKASEARQAAIRERKQKEEVSRPTTPSKKSNQRPEKQPDVLPPISPRFPRNDSPITPKSPNVDLGRKSNTQKEIERIKLEREDRRRKQAELRKMNEGLTEAQKATQGYRYLIEKFRQSLDLSQNNFDISQSIWKRQDTLKVVVRKRPINAKEIEDELIDIVTPIPKASIMVHEPKTALDLTQSIDTHNFQFDCTFGDEATSQDLYYSCVQPMVESFLSGGTSTFIAYGQTGSGKTHTVFGTRRDPGVVLLMLKQVLGTTRKVLAASFYEVYGNKIYDLLQGRRMMQLMEVKNGCVIQGLREYLCETMDDCLKVLDVGMKSRITAATEANPMSSRSHAVLQMKLYNSEQQVGLNEPGWPSFSVVDLAGSEKASETNVRNKTTLIEGAEINKSLLALKECIRALNSSASHIPFRASKLTMLLRDSLEITNNGSTNTVKKMVIMCATIRPTHDVAEHTLNTLRYANRLKETNRPSSAQITVDKLVFNPLEVVSDKTQQEDQDQQKTTGILESKSREDLMDYLMTSHLNCLQRLLSISQTREEHWLASQEPLSASQSSKYVDDLESSIEDKLQALLQLKEDLIYYKSQLE